jgi:probable H4MPT-linked C1 transfer pathway protein
MNWLAIDIGGANIKVADGLGYAQSHAFAMWREASQLSEKVRAVISAAPHSDHLAVTMTGELADCFATKAEGVAFILQALNAGFHSRDARVYLVDGRLVSPSVALTAPRLAAAANWHALARFCGRFVSSGRAVLIDVGSTTSDIIPLNDGMPAASGSTDTQRLLTGELVYTGVERSPLCAVVDSVPYRGQSCPIVQEVFATMHDAYLVLEMCPEEPARTATADGKPATRPYARVRLGRMIAADAEEFNDHDAVVVAQAAAHTQASLLADAIRQVFSHSGHPQTVVLSGHGEFLARAALSAAEIDAPIVSLTTELGQGVSRCAPAHALAVLAREMTSQRST